MKKLLVCLLALGCIYAMGSAENDFKYSVKCKGYYDRFPDVGRVEVEQQFIVGNDNSLDTLNNIMIGPEYKYNGNYNLEFTSRDVIEFYTYEFQKKAKIKLVQQFKSEHGHFYDSMTNSFSSTASINGSSGHVGLKYEDIKGSPAISTDIDIKCELTKL